MYEDLIRNAALLNHLDPNIFLRQMTAESGTRHDASALSPAGAQGVGQLMPGTAKMLGVTDPNDPTQNIDAAAKYDSQLLGQFHGSYPAMLAAYNWGPGHLAQAGGNVAAAPAETQGYLRNILPGGGTPAAPGPAQMAQAAPIAPAAPGGMPSIPGAPPAMPTGPQGPGSTPGATPTQGAPTGLPGDNPAPVAPADMTALQAQAQAGPTGRGTLADLLAGVANAAAPGRIALG